MRPIKPAPENARPPASKAADILRDQCDANEKLVLAMLRVQDDAEAARLAQESAEQEAGEAKKREAELAETAEFRERLIGIIGHDLRNPLNTVLMASGLLLAHGELAEGDARLVGRIVASGQRMARMIAQLAEFTRARLGGGFELTLAKADLGALCRDIAEELRISSSSEVLLTLEGDLAGTWDHDRLAEVFSNIVGNAIEHAAPGTPVVIHARGDRGGVVVEVTNQGACIPPDVLPKVFKAFRGASPRGDAGARRSAGHLGLGLYISSELVRAHGGTIEVRSTRETTTFTVRLPRVSPPSDKTAE